MKNLEQAQAEMRERWGSLRRRATAVRKHIDTQKNLPVWSPSKKSVCAEGRNRKMVDMLAEGRTLEEIGESFGISRQRVYQILKNEFERQRRLLGLTDELPSKLYGSLSLQKRWKILLHLLTTREMPPPGRGTLAAHRQLQFEEKNGFDDPNKVIVEMFREAVEDEQEALEVAELASRPDLVCPYCQRRPTTALRSTGELRACRSCYTTWQRFKRHGLTLRLLRTMLKKQNHKCAICSREFTFKTRRTTPCLDHCHASGHIRGLLCGSCNLALGLLQDDVAILDKATCYLRDSWDNFTESGLQS